MQIQQIHNPENAWRDSFACVT